MSFIFDKNIYSQTIARIHEIDIKRLSDKENFQLGWTVTTDSVGNRLSSELIKFLDCGALKGSKFKILSIPRIDYMKDDIDSYKVVSGKSLSIFIEASKLEENGKGKGKGKGLKGKMKKLEISKKSIESRIKKLNLLDCEKFVEEFAKGTDEDGMTFKIIYDYIKIAKRNDMLLLESEQSKLSSPIWYREPFDKKDLFENWLSSRVTFYLHLKSFIYNFMHFALIFIHFRQSKGIFI